LGLTKKSKYGYNKRNYQGAKMYLQLLTFDEQQNLVRALRGWQFDRERHGSLYDRGSADSYYGRAPDPHYGGVGGDSGERIRVTDPVSVEEYQAGYEDNERSGNRKNWL
jgi:hypothetical protein